MHDCHKFLNNDLEKEGQGCQIIIHSPWFHIDHVIEIYPADQETECAQASLGLNLTMLSRSAKPNHDNIPNFYTYVIWSANYSKTCLKQPLSKRPKIGFQDQLSLNAGQKYCIMLQGEHSAILSTFIKLPFVTRNFVLSIFEWPLKAGFTVHCFRIQPPEADTKGNNCPASIQICINFIHQLDMFWLLKRTVSL